MGIRFTCKNCLNRLNVKVSQAGFKRQCPHCSAEVIVPGIVSPSAAHSETIPRPVINSKKLNVLVGGGEKDRLPQAGGRETITNPDRQRMKRPTNQLTRHLPPRIGSNEFDQSVETFMLDKPQLPPTMGKVDPIRQAPKQIWYLRNKKLGELGPLKGKLMQRRLDAGDIEIGSLVWRGDWDGWIPAEKVFPSLVAEAEGLRLQQKRSRAFKALPIEFRRPTPQLKNKLTISEKVRRKNQLFAVFVVCGLVTILVLLVVAMKIVIDNS